MYNPEDAERQRQADLVEPYRRGQHVTYKGQAGFVVAGFDHDQGRVIIARDNPPKGDRSPQHILAEAGDLQQDEKWLNLRD